MSRASTRREQGKAKRWVLFTAPAATALLAILVGFSCNQGTNSKFAQQKPVYNAVFSPTASDSSAVLLDQQLTSVRFFIGPKDEKNAVESENWTVNAEIANNKENVPLVVTLICPFCSQLHVQSHPFTYFGAKRASSEAVFQFIPLLSKLAGTSGVGKLGFQVTRNGVETDYVVVNVRVTTASSATFAPSVAQPELKGRAQLSEPKWSSPIDLVLKVRQNANHLQVQLQPATDELATLFGGKELTSDGKGDFRWFNSGMLATDVTVVDRNFYSALYATVNNDSKLKSLLSGTQQGATGPAGDILLSAGDEQALLQPFFAAGRGMYNRLFVTGAEPDLRILMEKFRGYSRGDAAVRIRIESDGIYLPWQVFVPPGSSDPQELWGFKYQIAVNPTGIVLPGPSEGPMTYQSGPLVFGKYRSTTAGDIVATLADTEQTFLQSDLKIKGIMVADSRDSFLNALQRSRQDLQMIVTFTHGLSGTIITDTGGVIEDIGGPRLQFAKEEYVPAQALDDLLNTVPVSEPSMFRKSPLVFLNGCETGTSGFFATTNSDFGGTFLRMGSRGVIVTEAPVWSYFGFNFGKSLIRELSNGNNVPSAILATRRDFLSKLHNPLGLLYTYYGGPDVSVHFQ